MKLAEVKKEVDLRTKKVYPEGSRRGFTLIELLIVIAIIAILAIIIVIAINPARILEKSRDSQRFADLTTLATSINLYLADNHDFAGLLDANEYKSTDIADLNTAKKNDGTGWVPINFTLVSSGAPIASLPIDPTNDATNYYSFGVSVANKTYEINSAFENSDNTPKHSSDGGSNANRYEVGTDLTIL